MSNAVENPRPAPEAEIPEDEARRKRVKIDDESEGSESAIATPVTGPAGGPADDDAQAQAQALKEAEVGITGFVSAEGSGFAGIVKKRCVLLPSTVVAEC